MKIDKRSLLIIEKLNKAGFEAFVVGGCVRDSLLNKEPKDWDICTNAKTDEIMQVFKGFNIIETGIKHGTVTIMVEKEGYEVTTYRIDGEYTDGRHPDEVVFTSSLKEDLARRDFTINALAYNENTGVKDYFQGKEDLEKGIIRCVGNAEERFEEDGLRILRALRFSSVLGFTIEEETKKAIFNKINKLENVSKERINVEITKMLNGSNIEYILREYKEVLAYVVPEIKQMFDFQQYSKYHKYDVWEHTINVVKNCKEGLIRVAALFHDIGKPETYTFFEGQGHFYGHAVVSTKIAEETMLGLKFPNAEIEQVRTLIRYHDATFAPTKKFVLRMLNKMGEESFRLLIELRKADIKGQGKTLEGDDRLDRVAEVEEILNNLEEDTCFTLKALKINGKDLIEVGYKQGKEIGETLNELLDMVIEGNIENDKEKLLTKVKEKILNVEVVS